MDTQGEIGLYQGVQRAIRAGLARIEKLFDAVFGARANPLYYLGTLAVLFFAVLAVTGIYLYIFFDTGSTAAFQSVERITHGQWYIGGVMRSLHRYSADGLVFTMILHLLREFALDRFRGFRWFSWVSGVPLIWLIFFSGVNGYWLVWDRLAQHVAITTSEWLDWLPIFGEPIARNFLNQAALSDRFFTLLIFLHIGVPLFTLALVWLHVSRISRPRIKPPAALGFGTLAALLVLAFVKPAVSQGAANLDTVVGSISLDHFVLAIYPLFANWGYGAMWASVGALTLFVAALPWLAPRMREPVAVVDPPNCNGCGQCFADCPFGAVTMQTHPTRTGHQVAVVDADLCASCGICAGACPSSTPFRSAAELVTGIDMPQLSVHVMRAQLDEALSQLKGDGRVVVFGCDHAANVSALKEAGVATFSLRCIGQLPPSFVDYALREGGADGVLVTGCDGADCHFRFGNTWVEQRFNHEREPHLRTRAAKECLKISWAGVADLPRLRKELEQYRAALRSLPKPVATVRVIPRRAKKEATHG